MLMQGSTSAQLQATVSRPYNEHSSYWSMGLAVMSVPSMPMGTGASTLRTCTTSTRIQLIQMVMALLTPRIDDVLNATYAAMSLKT